MRLVKSLSWEATVRQKLCLSSSYTISRFSIDGKEVDVMEPSLVALREPISASAWGDGSLA